MSYRDLALVTCGAIGATILSYLLQRQRTNDSTNDSTTKTIAVPRIHSGTTNGTYTISHTCLETFVQQVFVHCGCLPAEAREAAQVLIRADLRGIDSHGIARLMPYYQMLKHGKINPRPTLRIVRETASTCTVDGDNGLGLIVGPKANAIAMRKAKECGSGWVSVRNTHHYGIAGGYSLDALAQDMIGISMTNSGAIVAPLYGKARYLGTNPIAIAFPGTVSPMVIDMSTSVVPWGKVEECARTGQALGRGWCIDETGQECMNPDQGKGGCVRQCCAVVFLCRVVLSSVLFVLF